MTKTQAEMMVHFMLKETTCDMLCKMLIAHVLHMPKGGKNYYKCIEVVVEFLEEGMPAHPGAFAMYYKILDMYISDRKVPDQIMKYTADNLEEIEKYYEGPLPEKYRPSRIIVPSKTILDATGTPVTMETPPNLVLV